MTSRSDSVRGTFSTSATMFTPNVVCSGGVLVELVEDDLGDLVALERDDDPHPAALGGVVLEVGDPADLLLAHELGDLHDEAVVAALLHGVGQLGDDDRLAAASDVLGVRLAAHAHAPAAGLVGVEDPLAAEDDAARREVRARHVRA